MQRIFFAFLSLLIFALAADRAPAQPTADTTPTLLLNRPVLRIAFLRREATGHPGVIALERLKTSLLKDPELLKELRKSGFTDIGLFSCDGAADMLRRLNVEEFDIAFTPANIYRQQTARYTAVLKARRQEDVFSPDGLVLRTGVIFVSRRSSLFGKKDITTADVQSTLAAQRLAVVTTQSVAGYNAPLLALDDRFKLRNTPMGFIWFENSEEVVKGVLAGLADIGACEKASIDRVLREANILDRKNDLLSIVVESAGVTPDPIVFRPELAKRSSTLGRLLRARLRELSLAGTVGEFQYVPTSDDEYKRLIELLKAFDKRIGDVPR